MRSLSTNDMVTALLVRGISGANDRKVSGRNTYHIVNVDLRLRSTPALSTKVHPGLSMSYARAAIPIRDLCEPSSIGSLAIEIRKAVVRGHASVARHPSRHHSWIRSRCVGFIPGVMGGDCLTSVVQIGYLTLTLALQSGENQKSQVLKGSFQWTQYGYPKGHQKGGTGVWKSQLVWISATLKRKGIQSGAGMQNRQILGMTVYRRRREARCMGIG